VLSLLAGEALAIKAPHITKTKTTAPHSVSLSWTASVPTPALPAIAVSYNVKRSPVSGGPYTIVLNVLSTTLVTNGTDATDFSVTGGLTYFYVVTALDNLGDESVNSNEASVTVPPDQSGPPFAFSLVPTPTSLGFSFTIGGVVPSSIPLQVADNSPCPPVPPVPLCHWPTTVATDQTWITTDVTSGTTAFTVNVSVNTTGLAAGTYTGNVILTSTQLSGSPISVPVSLTVTGVTPPVSTVTSVVPTCSPSSMTIGSTTTCTAVVNGTNNPSQAVTWTNGPTFKSATAGTFTITATSVQDPTKSGTTTVVVSPASVFPKSFKLICTQTITTPITVNALGIVTKGTSVVAPFSCSVQ
jgi:hypothetical protein